MAIDKIFPKSLNTDAEERLLQQGTMTDAMNITISEDGEGTASIAKNVTGTIPGKPLSNRDEVLNNRRIVAIGSASDSQRGFIYYIVADANSGVPITQSQHAIYQYNVTNDTYRLVLKDGKFNFDPDSFVKVDVVNGDFARNGGLQTVLFFTDNINPPRKINVDRAIAGDYSDISPREFEYSLNCIKAPNVYEPKASFTTDTNIDTNLFRDEAFQFATQIIYKDGEESAISPYSALVIPTQLTVYNIGEIGFGLGYNVDNVCIIDPNLSADKLLSSPDVSKIRFLFRSGNNGPFNIADEFLLNVPTTRSINGSATVVFDGVNNFRFYNDRVVTGVAPSEINKLFDNVPFQAKGQAVSGNRLMYSNYTEGRENTPASASLTAKYRKPSLAREELIDQTDQEFDITGEADIPTESITTASLSGGAGLTIKLKNAFGLEDASNDELESFIMEAGTVVSMSVECPLDITSGQEIPVEHTYTSETSLVVGDEFAQQQLDFSAEISITSLEFAGNVSSPVFPEGSGILEHSYFPLTNSGELKVPTLELQLVVPTDMPFMSFNVDQPQESFFDLFVSQLENSTFQGNYICKIKGTQTLQEGVNIGTDISTTLPLGGTGLDYTGLHYVSGSNLSFSTNTGPLTDPRFSVMQINFGFRVESNAQLGHISSDIIPTQFQPYDGSSEARIALINNNQNLFLLFPAFEGVAIDFPDDDLLSVSGGLICEASDDQFPTTINEIENSFSSQPTSLFEKKLSAIKSSQVSGFKAGALHNFGVVYYDKFNRSGFVNEIGNAYIEWFNKDGDNFRGNKQDPENYLSGPAAIDIKINSDPPEWAETYQIVYPGNSSVSDFVQYTVGGAFPARVKHAEDAGAIVTAGIPNRDIDTESKRLYVSLETLDQYRSERNTFRDYSYTEGDKLRVISLKNEIASSISVDTDEDDLESIFKGASDGTIIEFDVVGVELLAKDIDNPIAFEAGATAELANFAAIPEHMTGKFLVLESSAIAGGAFGEDGEILKYPGFDWNHVSAYYRGNTATQGSSGVDQADFDYLTVGDNAPTPVNSWRQRSVVEIYTPKLSTENKFYYEIGEKRNLGRFGRPQDPINHGPEFTLDSGDINYRPVPCKTLFFDETTDDAAASFKDDYKDYVYKTEELESFTVSDKIGEKMWSQGRPHIKYDNAATFRRFNGVTYSDAYAEDVDRLSLISFNPTLANFYSFDSQYGACNYISNYGSERQGYDTLVGIQENKFSQTPVNTSIITDAAGSNNVALSTNVLTTTTYYAGDYGCGNHPESVLVQDNDVYFFDRSRKKVLRLSGNQLVPISDSGVSSTINDATDAFNKVFDRKSGKVVSGYDPDDNVYYITFHYPQALSHHSEEVSTLVPLYLTTDFNQDGTVTGEDSAAFMAVFNQVTSEEITEAEAAAILDVSFQALDPDNPDVLTLSSAATFDITDGSGTPDGLVTTADLLLAITQFGVPSPVNTVIDGVTYIQYVNIHDADGNPIPVMTDGQPVFVDVSTDEIVFADGSPIDGETPEDLDTSGFEIDIPFNPEYNNFVTLSYNAEGGFWQSKNSYYPDIYTNQDNKMYTAKYIIDSATPPPLTDGNALMFHRHEDLKTEGDTVINRCTFYNQPTSESFIEVVSNANPSSAKVYDALSYEGDSAAFKASIESFLGNKKGIANIGRLDFVNKEGSYYSAIGGDISENSTNHVRLLGYVVGVGENQITIHDAPSGAVTGAVLKTVDGQGVLSDIGVIAEEEITIEGEIATVANGVNVNVSGPVNESIVGTTVIMELPRKRNGDSIRGHYAKIKISTEEGENVGKYELFCVNAHVTPSDLHHIN